jgi:hypothetical protein
MMQEKPFLVELSSAQVPPLLALVFERNQNFKHVSMCFVYSVVCRVLCAVCRVSTSTTLTLFFAVSILSTTGLIPAYMTSPYCVDSSFCSRQVTMVILLDVTPKEWLGLGLEAVGFVPIYQDCHHAMNVKRFVAHFGASPVWQ